MRKQPCYAGPLIDAWGNKDYAVNINACHIVNRFAAYFIQGPIQQGRKNILFQDNRSLIDR